MAKYKPAKPKGKQLSPKLKGARGAIPCAIVILALMALGFFLFYSVLTSSQSR